METLHETTSAYYRVHEIVGVHPKSGLDILSGARGGAWHHLENARDHAQEIANESGHNTEIRHIEFDGARISTLIETITPE